jgi:SAM-dependent methyltransferase
MGYFDWHDQPGYYRDVTRHFEPSTELLDLGCGVGWLADHFDHYTGVDVSPDAVAEAQRRGRNVSLGNLDQALAFELESFDGIVLKDVLEHVADPVFLVREAHRLLRPGGRVFASSPDAQRWVWDDYTHRRPFTRKSYRLLFRDQGFEILESGYESVAPGTGIVSGLLPGKRRPGPLRAAARLPIVRRNVWLLAQRPREKSR